MFETNTFTGVNLLESTSTATDSLCVVYRPSGLGSTGTSLDSSEGINGASGRPAADSAQWPGYPGLGASDTQQSWKLPGRSQL